MKLLPIHCRWLAGRLALGTLLAAGVSASCSDGKRPGAGATDGGATADGSAVEEEDASLDVLPCITLTDEMNYAFKSSLAVTTTPVRANGDLTFDWSAATVDMLGRELDPLADVDMMQLMLWRYTKEAFLAGVNQDELELGRMVAMGYCDTQRVRSSCRLFDLVAPAGSPIAQDKLLAYVNPKTYSPATHVWVSMLATGKAFGQGTRLLAFFQPTDGESNDVVQFAERSTTLHYTVNLASLQPIPLPPGTGDVVLSWADDARLTKNAMGDAWVPTYITDVTIGHFVGYTVADLARDFLRLSELASEQYGVRLNVGQETPLSSLTDLSGKPFPGIDANGLWLVTLGCGSCRNPAPWFLSILQPQN